MNVIAPVLKSSSRPVPALTITLVVLNLALSSVAILAPDSVGFLAFFPNRPTAIGMFGCLFLHVNIVHLLGNLVFLAAVGPLVEFSRGAFRFGLIYLLGGLVGVSAFWAWSRMAMHSDAPLLGASAAVSACFGYASVVFFSKKVPLAPGLSVPVWIVGLIWLALQVGGAFVQIGGVSTSSIAYVAHLAGFLFGVLTSLLLRVPKEQSMILGHEVLNRLNSGDHHTVVGVADLHLKSHPHDVPVIYEKANALVALGKRSEAAKTIKPLLSSADRKRQVEAIDFLAKLGQLGVISSTERLKLSEALESKEPAAAIQLVESALSGPVTDPERPHALFELAMLLRHQAPDRTLELVSELRTRFELHPATQLAKAKGLIP